MYDVLIIGAGPAGMTAGIYAARKKLKTLILSQNVGGQMVWSSDIENYSGFSMIDGVGLTQKFKDHLASVHEDLELKEGAEVKNLERHITSFEVLDQAGSSYYAKTVIIASGKNPKMLNIPGEQKFFGHGVAVCATCDAPLYKNKTVAVVGGGNSAMDAIMALSKTAKKIYSINNNQELVGDEFLKRKVLQIPGLTFYTKAEAKEIFGEQSVTAINILNQNSQEESIKVDGVFVEVGYTPSTAFDQLTEKNAAGEIKVDQNLQTSVPGLFAAGDVNDAWGEQIVIAAGEGAKAALAAAAYLTRQR